MASQGVTATQGAAAPEERPAYTPPDFWPPPPADMLTLSLERALKSHEDLPAWRQAMAQGLRAALNLPLDLPGAPAPPHAAMACEQKEGYRRHKFSFTCFDGETVLAYLLLPDSASPQRPAPGVLALYGHGLGARSTIGQVPSTDGQQAIAQALARQGYAVVVPEMRTFGERELPPFPNLSQKTSHEIYANYSMAMGRPLLMLHLAEAFQSLEIARAWPGVDGGRLGVVGLSQGGRLAAFAAALDPRLGACVVASGICCATQIYRGYCHLHDELVGLLRYADYPDAAGLISPRPLLLTYGAQEWGPYGIEGEQKISYQRIRRVYAMEGAEEMLLHRVHPAGHTYDVPMVLEFLGRHLPSRLG